MFQKKIRQSRAIVKRDSRGSERKLTEAVKTGVRFIATVHSITEVSSLGVALAFEPLMEPPEDL